MKLCMLECSFYHQSYCRCCGFFIGQCFPLLCPKAYIQFNVLLGQIRLSVTASAQSADKKEGSKLASKVGQEAS
jgi:hypothetical protein